jgi:diguanylate cyclase (GGDEF)-like protein
MHRTAASAHSAPRKRLVDADALRRLFLPLPLDQQPAFDLQVEHDIAQLLPLLGPMCGVFVILFGAWDAWLAPLQAATALRIRVAMVLLGAIAYGPSCLPWSPSRRCAWLYATHAGAVVACAALPPQGLVLALPGITGVMFLLALVEPRPRRFLLAVLPPSVLLVGLAALRLPPSLFLNTVLLYGLSLPLALAAALASLALRRRSFLAEQVVLHAFRHDSLSGALSRGYVTELAMHDVALARRHGRPLAVAMLDIDWFKRVNDTFGHACGDQALCALVTACRAGLRASDYVGRIGGEEFVCVMPEACPEDALACAERIRRSIAALSLPTALGPLRFTVSIGVAVLDHQLADWPALLRAADTAMYQAKKAGRNRTVLAPHQAPSRAPAPGAH